MESANELTGVLASFMLNSKMIFAAEYRYKHPIYMSLFKTVGQILCKTESLNPTCSIFLISITSSFH